MEKIFDGTVVSYTQGVNVLDQIRHGLPATLSLALGAGFIWLTLGILFGVVTAIRAGRFADRALTVLAFVGVSSPPFFLGALGEDYVRTARAKGISERRVLTRHVLRNSLVPIIALWGLDFAQIIGGG